jgi:predicted PurR-regulated permease PerM
MRLWNPRLVKPTPYPVSPTETASPAPVEVKRATTATVSGWQDRRLSYQTLLFLTAVVAYLTYITFRPFLKILFVALIMAIVFFPLHKRFSRMFRNANIAALVTTVLAVLLILVPFVLINVKLAVEATNIYSSVLQSLGNPATWAQMDPVIQKAADTIGTPPQQLKADIEIRAREAGKHVLAVVVSFSQRFLGSMGTIAVASIFLFPLLRSSNEFRLGALSLLPLSPNRAHELAHAVNEGVIADIYGVVYVGLAEGITIALGFWMAGLSSPLVWGSVAVVLSCLPLVGVSLVWVPACVLLALRGHWISAALLLIWCASITLICEGTFRSAVVSGRTRVNSMLISLSILGGVVTFGPIGIFAGPVLLVLLAALIRILREERTVPRDPVGLGA